MDYYRPNLDEIVGQDRIVRYMRNLAANPRQEALLFLGQPGIGKTVTAHAFADIVAGTTEFEGHWTVPCTELGVSDAKRLFSETMRLRFNAAKRFNVLILEEMELLSPQCQGYMKAAIDKSGDIFPKHLIVIATSNSVKNIADAVLERFKTFTFDHSGDFYKACRQRIASIWSTRTSEPIPPSWTKWGVDGKRFSMRQALSELEIELESVS